MREIERREHSLSKRLLVFLLFIAVWELTALFTSITLFPSPTGVFSSLINILVSEVFFPSIIITTGRVIAAVLLSVVFCSFLLLLSIYSDFAEILLYDIIFVLFYTLPGILWTLIIVVILGLSPAAPILIVAIAASRYYLINVMEGLKDINYKFTEVGDLFGEKEIQILRHTLMPQMYPSIMAGLRSALTAAWRVVILAEIFTATSGIGHQLNSAFSLYNSEIMAAWGVVILVILMFTDKAIRKLDAEVLRKHRKAD